MENGRILDIIGDAFNPAEDTVQLLVTSPNSFWLRLALRYDLGLGEAFMAGEFEARPDVCALLRLLIRNRDGAEAHAIVHASAFGGKRDAVVGDHVRVTANAGRVVALDSSSFSLTLIAASLFGEVSGSALQGAFVVSRRAAAVALSGYAAFTSLWGRIQAQWFHRANANSVEQTSLNIAAHYDLSNKFFAAFLDSTMSYSCGVFASRSASLLDAQCLKWRLLANKLRVCSGNRVLEIGFGWGALSILLAKFYGVHVTGITQSHQVRRLQSPLSFDRFCSFFLHVSQTLFVAYYLVV